jgi:hypothetical protein
LREWRSNGAYSGVYRDRRAIFVEASSAVAVQAVVAAKGGDHGGGNSIGADAIKAQEPGSSHQKEGVADVAPEDEAEEDAASGSMQNVPGAEHASGGGMMSGGQSSGVGASGGSTELTAASTETEEPFLVGASSAVAVQAAAAAKGGDLDGGGTAGADATKAQEPGRSQQEEGVVGVAPEEEATENFQ